MTLAKEKPPIFGVLQRGGEVVIRMLEDVKQATIGLLVERKIAKGALIYTDQYVIYIRLGEWDYDHKTVCHAVGECARDDGDGFCEVHVNILEGPGRCSDRSYVPTVACPGELAAVHGILRVRAQRPGSREQAVGCPDRPVVGTIPQSIVSHHPNCEALSPKLKGTTA